MSKGMLVALCLSIALALSLSWLPDQALRQFGSVFQLGGKLQEQGDTQGKTDVPVMKMDGLVNELGTLGLAGHLQKIVWEHDKLTVWLAVPPNRVTGDAPWQDAYRIAYRFLTGAAMYKGVDVNVTSSDKPELIRFTIHADTADLAQAPTPGTPEFNAFVTRKMQSSGGR